MTMDFTVVLFWCSVVAFGCQVVRRGTVLDLSGASGISLVISGIVCGTSTNSCCAGCR